jgi:uncharacterized BrkB/YihY/UPF0761 family membrane protein
MAVLAERLTALRERGETLPGAPLALEAMRRERELGGGLLAGGVAFRVFLWLVPFGLVLAAALSLWSEHDPEGLESAARDLGVGAAAAEAAAESLQSGDRNALLVLLLGLGALAWFTLGAIRAFVLAYALAWHLDPPRIRRPLRSIAVFNGLFLLGFLSSAGEAWLREQIGATALLGVVLTFAATTAIALCAMWLLPHRATHPRELLPGAALFAGGHQLVQVVVLFYFAPELGERRETYGAFGAAGTMLLWLYVLSRLATGAAFLNATLCERGRESHRDDRSEKEIGI